MQLAVILLAQLLHREILIPVEAKSADQNAQPAKSEWPLKECQEDTGSQLGKKGCVCGQQYQVCQPLQLSATVNESVILPCRFTYHHRGWPSGDTQVHWRLGTFHSSRFLFNCCQGLPHIDRDFQGRVSLAREEGQPFTASIRITALRESDAQLYFCRVSVKTNGRKEEWQTIHGTNLTVTASPQQPEERNNTTPLPLGLLIGASTGAILLAAGIVLGLALILLTQRKGHCKKRTQTRRVASRGQEEKEADSHELRYRGAGAPPQEKPVSSPPPVYPRARGESDLMYATLVLSDAPDHERPSKRAGRTDEETTYAAVRP